MENTFKLDFSFFSDFVYLFPEVGEEKERQRSINVWMPLPHPPSGELACNSGMCPDWESNPQSFGSQARAQSTKLHQPGQFMEHLKDIPSTFIFLMIMKTIYEYKEKMPCFFL